MTSEVVLLLREEICKLGFIFQAIVTGETMFVVTVLRNCSGSREREYAESKFV